MAKRIGHGALLVLAFGWIVVCAVAVLVLGVTVAR